VDRVLELGMVGQAEVSGNVLQIEDIPGIPAGKCG
jgi:hypothetical protein